MTVKTDDPEWLARLRAGDDEAWAEWFADHGARVWTYAARLIGADAAAVADTVQEVFLSASAGLADFDNTRGTLISWLLGITHRKVAQFWRQQKRRQEVIDAWSQQQLTSLFDVSLDSGTDHADLAAAVRSVAAMLPADAAAILVGRYLEERSTTELAVDFGISEQAVRSRLTRARERFRELFEIVHREFVS